MYKIRHVNARQTGTKERPVRSAIGRAIHANPRRGVDGVAGRIGRIDDDLSQRHVRQAVPPRRERPQESAAGARRDASHFISDESETVGSRIHAVSFGDQRSAKRHFALVDDRLHNRIFDIAIGLAIRCARLDHQNAHHFLLWYVGMSVERRALYARPAWRPAGAVANPLRPHPAPF